MDMGTLNGRVWIHTKGQAREVYKESWIRVVYSHRAFGKRRYNERPQDLVAVLPDGITLSMASSFF